MTALRYGVSEEKQHSLEARMAALNVREEDIIERFVRSSGPGGQNVNKTSTCVYLKHVPTGIEVKCQQERSQALNRYIARRTLLDKVEMLVTGKASEAQQQREKIRRQKRRRSRRAKEKMLVAKHHTALKKKDRSFTGDPSDP
jgi:peptide chain release factor